RNLHSFPTRRSSDLCRNLAPMVAANKLTAAFSGNRALLVAIFDHFLQRLLILAWHRINALRNTRMHGFAGEPDRGTRLLWRYHLDRKSTRLNSSHVK